MKKPLVLLFALALIGAGAVAGGSGWQTDFDKAAKLARKSGKPILVEFTDGESSKMLNKKVFYTTKFKTWSKKNVVLLEVNLAKRVNKKLAAQYADLKKKYKVEELPTVLMLSEEGKLLGKPTFSERGGVDTWLEEAKELVEAASGAGAWLTDFAQAKKLAKRTRKPMLVDFNGSDW